MIIRTYKITPEDIEIFIQSEGEAEAQLLKFCESQALFLSPEEGWINTRFVLRGTVQR